MKLKPVLPLFVGFLVLVTGISFLISNNQSIAATVPAPVASLSIRADFVSYLYRCMLQREPDQAGLDFWVGTMASDPDPVNHLYYAFYAAQDKSLSNTAFITEMYNCVLFRNPNDPPDGNFSGRDFWANEMNLGHQTQLTMLDAFLGSSEYSPNPPNPSSIFSKLSALPVSVATPTPIPTPIPTPTPSSFVPTPTPTPVPVNPVNISLSASALTISPGQTVYLSWSVANATPGTIAFNNNIGTVGDSGNLPVTPTVTTTYILSGSNSLGTVSRSVTVTIVSVAPSVSISSPQPGESWTVGTTHPIVWTSNQSPSATVTISIGSTAIVTTAPNSNLYNWVIPSNFIPGQYMITVSINDTSTIGQSGSFSVVVVATPTPVPTPTPTDTTSPLISSISNTNIGQFSADINWTTSEPANGQIVFLNPCPSTGCATPIVSTFTTVHTINIFNLSSGVTYAYQIRSRDAAGNLGTANQSFTTQSVSIPTSTPSVTPTSTPIPTPTPINIVFPTRTDDFINSLYTCVLGRTVLASQDNPDGFSFWKNTFLANRDVSQLYHAFYESSEFGKRNLSNSDFVAGLYNCALFRNPNSTGFNEWSNAINSGTLDRSHALDPGFMQSWEFQNIVLPKLKSLLPVISSQINLDSRLGVAHVAGFYPNHGADFMVKGAQDARNLGFQGIELYMAPEMCGAIKDSSGNFLKNAYQTSQIGDWCDPNPGPANIDISYRSLAQLAANPRYRAVFNMNFKNYFITAETINPDRVYPEPADCIAAEMNRINTFNVGADCYKNGFSQRQLKSLHDDFYSLFAYLLQTYKNSGKTFVIMSGNELENHYLWADGKTSPDWAKNNLVSYLNTISQALTDAKAAMAPAGVNVYHACEFASVSPDSTGSFATRDFVINSGINYVVPKTHCDLYGWSAWDYTINHLNDDNYITKGLDYYASKAPNSTDFGNRNVFLSEFGDPERLFGTDNVVKVLNNGIDKALAWGAPYVLYWQLYDNDCNPPVFPVTSESQCKGHWIRKPATDATQLGSLSDVYTQVFLPRREY